MPNLRLERVAAAARSRILRWETVVKNRIVHLIPSFRSAGVVSQLKIFASREAEFESHVCAIPTADETTAGEGAVNFFKSRGMETYVARRRWQFDPCAWEEVRAFVKRLNPSIVHAWAYPTEVYGWSAAQACCVPRFVVSFRSSAAAYDGLRTVWDRFAANKADAVVTSGESLKKRHVGRGLSAEKFHVIGNGAEAASEPALTRGQLLADLGLPENSRLVCFAGRLCRRNRVKDAIWAADLLKVIRKDVHLLIFGEGSHEERLRLFREHVQIEDLTHFMGWRDDWRELLPHFDAVWSPGTGGGQLNVIAEAASAGVPVVAAEISAVQDVVTHDETGFLVPTGDRAGIARWTLRILDEPARGRRVAEAAHARWAERFSAEACAEKYAALYRKLA